MKLEGSCHCGAIRFRVVSSTPYPYNRCYCTICRKTAGGGGYAVNIMGLADTLEVEGGGAVKVYRAPGNERNHVEEDGRSSARRHFCGACGSALWLWDPNWPDAVYPFASAIDTPLPRPSEHTVLMTRYAAGWAEIAEGPGVAAFELYPEVGIAEWHRARGLHEG